MKPMRPTLRPKRRYVLARVLADQQPPREQLTRAILAEGGTLYGDVGMSELALRVVHVRDGWVLIRCQRGEERRVVALLACITHVGGERVHIMPIATTGTIRSAMRRIERGTKA